MRLFSSLLVLTLISVSAGARENHCDHSSGKATGTVVGGILGGVVGGLLGKGKAAPIIVGGVAGGAAGRAIGDDADDQRDFDECGTDAESFQRQVDRDERAAYERDAQARQRADEIAYDREMARRGRAGYPAPRPRRLVYQCQEVRRGRFVVVYLPTNRIVQEWGRDLYGCQYSERQANSRY